MTNENNGSSERDAPSGDIRLRCVRPDFADPATLHGRCLVIELAVRLPDGATGDEAQAAAVLAQEHLSRVLAGALTDDASEATDRDDKPVYLVLVDGVEVQRGEGLDAALYSARRRSWKHRTALTVVGRADALRVFERGVEVPL